jgi:hypothetical protein
MCFGIDPFPRNPQAQRINKIHIITFNSRDSSPFLMHFILPILFHFTTFQCFTVRLLHILFYLHHVSTVLWVICYAYICELCFHFALLPTILMFNSLFTYFTICHICFSDEQLQNCQFIHGFNVLCIICILHDLARLLLNLTTELPIYQQYECFCMHYF